MQQIEFAFTEPSADVRLTLVGSPETAWRQILQPWFKAAGEAAFETPRPPVVLVPDRVHAQWLKGELLSAGQSIAGVRFVTPAGLRATGAQRRGLQRPLREHLRLLLASVAHELGREPGNENSASTKAVERTPEHLLRTLEKLEASGWSTAALETPHLAKLAQRFRETCRACGFELAGEFDRRFLAEASRAEPLFEDLLVYGFDAAHWPLWFLLRAAVCSAACATIVLWESRDEAGALDQLWVGSWEQEFGEARVVAPAEDEEQTGGGQFLIARDAPEQSEAIAQLVLQFLSEESCRRIGVLFPRPAALARLVSAALARRGVPHNDAIGFGQPGRFEEKDWQTWLQLQQAPRLEVFLRFLRALPAGTPILGGVSLHAVEDTLRRCYADLLLDDLAILKLQCTDKPAAGIFEAVDLLPRTGSLSGLLRATERALTKLGWQDRWQEIAALVSEWSDHLPQEIPRSLYLRWLGEVATSLTVAREAAGDHPYARVHLLTIAQAQAQSWSHLIFAGMNEGDWPPSVSADLPPEQEIEEFNARLRQLNQRVTRQGGQGEGHVAIREGYAVFLGANERRQIALRQFAAVSETPVIALSAALIQDEDPERLRNPSELFTRLYFETTQRPLTAQRMASLRHETRQWLRREAEEEGSAGADILQTKRAYLARREITVAGEYDFAFRAGTARATGPLNVSELECLVTCPAIIWLGIFLGVEPSEDESDVWITSTGQWVHRWLASVGGAEQSFVRLPSRGRIDASIRADAEQKLKQASDICAAAGRELPAWWISGWQNARSLARLLGSKLGQIGDWPWLATEWKIEAGEPVPLNDTAALQLRGRIDLLLALSPPPPVSLAAEPLWLADFKTGYSKRSIALSDRVEKRGDGVRKGLLRGASTQLALYGLAVRQRGGGDIRLAIISPAVRPVEPQLWLTDVLQHGSDIFAELGRMQATGQFGMYGAVRSRFGYTPAYPIATLAIDQNILIDKWDLTHPALAREEEDYF